MNEHLRSEAAVIKRALHWRCVTAPEAASWADVWITRLDDPPPALIDLSLATRAPEADAADLLEPLARDVAAAELVPETLGLLARTLAHHPERLDLICAALWDLSFERLLPTDVDDEVGSAKFRLEDARLGVHDTIDDVAADVARALQPYQERFAAA
jgi:hypothetical protein